MKIIRPLLGRLTQGSLFTCASAENYPTCSVFGFVITARCDVEQDKYPILNYLPVVPLDDWLDIDGFYILHSRLYAESNGAIRSLMKECDISLSVLLSQPLERIGAEFFASPYENKQHKTRSEKFLGICDRISLLDDIGLQGRTAAGALYAINEKASTNLIKELSLQRLPGYYFLPSVYDTGDDRGYVILLREVKHLSRPAAAAVANGVDAADANELAKDAGLSFHSESFAMPIGEVTSPDVEHIMQTFSQLFGRIGLEDLPTDYLDQIATRRPRSGGAQ